MEDGKKNTIKTIHDIAQEAGVSATTVSFVINGKGSINPNTRERVLEIIKRSNYAPNKVARQLRKKQTYSFGVVIDHFHNSFFNSVFDGISSVAEPAGYSYLAAESRGNYEKEKREIQLLLEHGVDGLILFPCTDDASFLLEQQQRFDVPIVLIGNNYSGVAIPTVSADNYFGAYLATRRLIELNRPPVWHIAGPQAISMCRQRRAGFMETLEKYSLIANPSDYVIVADDISISAGYLAMEQICRLAEPPFSIFAVNDVTAFGVIKYCKQHHLSIPEEMYLIGFGNIDLIEELDIGLSSIRISAVDMGKQSARMLINCQKDHIKKCRENDIILPVELMERKSTFHFSKT